MQELTLKRGDTFALTFEWRQTGENDGDPVDLTGCSARLQVRNKRSKELLMEGSTATGEITIDPLIGKVSVRIESDVTKGLPLKDHRFDLELTYPDGTVQSTETMSLLILEDYTENA